MGIPQWLYLLIVAYTLFVEYNLDGHRRIGNYSFIPTVIAQVLLTGLFYWGGFFG